MRSGDQSPCYFYYDLKQDDFVVAWADSNLEIRAEDLESARADGRGVRITVGGHEVPVADLLALLNDPWISRRTKPEAQPPKQTGGCACGAVRYSFTGPMRPIVACHCEVCRRSSGHHVAATSCLRETLTITGEVKWWSANPGYRRGFCPKCGSQLFWERETSRRTSILAGSLDEPTGLMLAGHIHTGEKGDYYRICDGLPSAPGHDPVLTTDPEEG